MVSGKQKKGSRTEEGRIKRPSSLLAGGFYNGPPERQIA